MTKNEMIAAYEAHNPYPKKVWEESVDNEVVVAIRNGDMTYDPVWRTIALTEQGRIRHSEN